MQLRALNIFPVKSFAGITAESATAAPRGFEGDRRFMLVDEHGSFLTQRQLPQMSQIRCAFEREQLVLRARGHQDFRLPPWLHEGERVDVEIWRDRCEAVLHAEGSEWTSRVLQRPTRLVYMPDDAHRVRSGSPVSFADGFPYMLTTESSLRDLNRRLAQPVSMDRFRPNLVLDGEAPYAEDSWSRVVVGTVRFRVTKPCERCVITTIDLATGGKGKEPLRTLSTYRKTGSAVHFGVNLVAESCGDVRVGEPVVVE